MSGPGTGTPGLEHRIGGIEKENETGNVNYEPENHEKMVKLREAKVNGVADGYAPTEVYGEQSGKLCVLGWGSTYGAIRGAVDRAQAAGLSVSQVHVRNVFPMPKDLGEVLSKFDQVLVPELNRGQFSRLVRAEYLIDTISYPKVQGKPFTSTELLAKIEELHG